MTRCVAFSSLPSCKVPARRVAVSAKKDIHPELVPSKVICNGEEVAELTGTQSEYHVEVWSGNHPFYKGDSSALVLDEGQVNKFKARFAGSALGNVATLSDSMKDDDNAATA
eukprot:jgi/Ulvmu1/10852/UM007_0026.1